MRYRSRIVLVVLSLMVLAPAPRAQQPAAAGVTLSVTELVDRITKAEAALTSRMRAYHPLVEVYIQNLAPDPKLGTVPTHDDYFLGQFDGKDGPNLIPLSPSKGSFQPTGLSRPFGVQYLPAGFCGDDRA
jgi:hypothetical protein